MLLEPSTSTKNLEEVVKEPIIKPQETTATTSVPLKFSNMEMDMEPLELKPVHSFAGLTNGFADSCSPNEADENQNRKRPSLPHAPPPPSALTQVVNDLDLSDDSSDGSSSDSDDDNTDGSKGEDEAGGAVANILDQCENLEKNLNQSAMDIDGK